MARGKWIIVALAFLVLGAIIGILLIISERGSAFVWPSPAPSTPQVTPLPSTSTSPSPTLIPTYTPTPPPKEFTVCQAKEPNTLFVYGNPSLAARNVLAAIYDGPLDTNTYQFQPVILEKLPTLQDEDAAMHTVEVEQGSKVVGLNEMAVDLLPGVPVLNAAGQEVTFEGGVVTMTQMVVTFTLRTDVTWADDHPLTSDDFLYSFELASEFNNPGLRFFQERTRSYEAAGERTIVWTSVPGYRDTSYSYLYFLNFYPPLPRHVWGNTQADQLFNSEIAHLKPLGWGPFVVEEWMTGDHITLVRNPHYFRAAEGLPHLDRVTFRFVPDLQQALDMLAVGDCDLITRDVIEDNDSTLLSEAADAGTVQLVSSPTSEWEHLDFGIESASWVHGPDFFGDEQVRQAIAMCIDRERIAHEAFQHSAADLAHSYIASDHPLFASDRLHHWSYSPPAGRSLLEEVGWRDENSDGIREAHGVANIYDGVPFTITLLTTSNDQARERTISILNENLEACGIGSAVGYFPDEEFFADGPDGPVLGRQFDLALFSWMNGLDIPCWLYLSSEIPDTENWWATSNNPGYANAEYDEACQSALDALPGTNEYDLFHSEAQRIFSHDVPVLPLYFVPKIVAVRPEVSGVILDPSERIDLWNIEAFDLIQTAGQ